MRDGSEMGPAGRALLRLLLLCYPRSLRDQYGSEVVAFLVQQRHEPQYRGMLGAGRYWTETVVDFGVRGAGERFLENKRRWTGRGRGKRRDSVSMELMMKRFRMGIRRLILSPTFSLVVLITLGLGIGANTAIFSVVNAVLLKPLPYEEPDQLMVLNHLYPSLDLEASVSAQGFRDYSQQISAFSSMAAASGWQADLTGEGDPERLAGATATFGYFETLGVQAEAGRFFTEAADLEDPRVLVITHGLWQRLFGADPDLLGRTLQINSEPYTLVGIMPPEFQDPFVRDVEAWTPLELGEDDFARGYTNEWLRVLGRLADGATPERAQQELDAFAAGLKEDPSAGTFSPEWGIQAKGLPEMAVEAVRPAILVLLGAVVFVLLIACANVANLLLSRAMRRRRDVAVRMALGAGRRQVLAELMVDGLVLGVVGSLVGLGMGAAGLHGLKAVTAGIAPRLSEASLDGTVLLFTLGVSVATGLLVALAPALGAARTDVQGAIREGDRGGTERSGLLLRRIFVVSQFALALALLAGAGLLLRSMARLQAVDPGFEPAGLVTFHLSLPSARYPTPDDQRLFFDRVLEEIRAVPGVEGVGGTSVLPFGGGWSTSSFEVEGYEPGEGEPSPWGDVRVVSPGFAEALGLPVLRGRFLEFDDGPDASVAVVVDEVLAERYWPGQEALGRRIRFGEDWMEVVGVVGHAAHEGLDAEARVQVYGSYRQWGRGGMYIAVRAGGGPGAMVSSIREAVHRIDPALPLARLATMETLIAESVGDRRVSMLLLGVFAAVALLLAATGIFGVMSQAVAQRTREMGVRIAVGADRGQVLGLVLRQGLALTAVGVVVGLLGSLALTGLLRSQLFGVEPTDPPTFLAVTGILVLVATLACLIPAFRATRIDPVRALRQE